MRFSLLVISSLSQISPNWTKACVVASTLRSGGKLADHRSVSRCREWLQRLWIFPCSGELTLASARPRPGCPCYDTCSSVLSHARNLGANLCISFRHDVYLSWQACMKSERVHFEFLLQDLRDDSRQLFISMIWKGFFLLFTPPPLHLAKRNNALMHCYPTAHWHTMSYHWLVPFHRDGIEVPSELINRHLKHLSRVTTGA